MDILCVGMLRSCSTWQYEVATHLVERHLGGTRLGYLEGVDYARLPLATETRWRVTKAHYRHPVFADRIANGLARPIYSYRDVRDVVFSMAYKFGLSFEELLAAGKLHALIDDDRFWRAQPGVLIQRYEEIVSAPIKSVRQVATFLGLELAPREADRIASEYSFESNLKRTEALARLLENQGVDLSNAHNVVRHDPATLLHWNHLRSGRVGAWREEATLAQRRTMAELFGPWLEQNGYAPDDLKTTGSTEMARLKLHEGPKSASASSRTRSRPRSGWNPSSLAARLRQRLPVRLHRWLSSLRIHGGV